MRYASITVALLTLTLMFMVPVGAAPSLQAGSSATYNVSITVSFSPPPCITISCSTSADTGSQANTVCCPIDLPSIEINGTIGWTATKVNDTTAVLNVTHSLATFLSDNLTTPIFTNTGSFNESINLANRTIDIVPIIMPEMEQALQSLPSISSLTSQVDTISSVMWARPSVHTMWWVNAPLKLNETVPVLVFPTNVTSSTSLNLGNIGTRTAWTLAFNLVRPSSEQTATDAYPIPVGDNLVASFSFNYDQQNDLLLSAAANIHLGFPMPIPYQPNPCTSSGTTACPASSGYATFVQSGINIQATLKLSKTNLNLDHRLGSTDGNSPGSISGPSGPSGGPSSGGTSTGPGPGTSSGPVTTGTGSGPTGGANPNQGTTTKSTPTKPASGVPWLYWILAIVAVAVIVTGIFFSRRRAAKNRS